MSHKLPYTMIRGRIYYTNFRTNDSSSCIRISLGTDSYKQAEMIMAQVRSSIPLVQSGAMDINEFKQRLQGYRDATKKDFDAYLLNNLRNGLYEAKLIPQLGRYGKNLTTTLCSPKETAKEANNYANHFLEGLYNGSEIGSSMMLTDLTMKKLYVKKADLKQVHTIASKVDISQALMYQAYEAFYSKDMVKYYEIIETMKSSLDKAEAQAHVSPEESIGEPQTNHNESPTSKSPTLQESWSNYIKDKGQKWSNPVARENQRFFDVLYHVTGNLPINDISRQSIKKALNIAQHLPKRTKRPYSHMSIIECIKLNNISKEDEISSEHVNKHLKLWKSFFHYLLNDKEILKKDPTEGVNHDVKSNVAGCYTANEIKNIHNKLISLPDNDFRKWYFLTLIYTGARRSEISHISKHQIRQDQETSRWYIFIEKGKSLHAKRRIPLHKIIEQGILSKVTELHDDDLVFNLPSYSTITKNWKALISELNIPARDEFACTRNIHSLRHSFISTAIAATSNHTLVQFIVGHSRTKSLGVTSRYTHNPAIKDLVTVIDSIKYT